MVQQVKDLVSSKYGFQGIIFAALVALVTSVNLQASEREKECQAQLKENAAQIREIAENNVKSDLKLIEAIDRLADKIERKR